jgi:LPXTG-motif cell wall-anchored protein
VPVTPPPLPHTGTPAVPLLWIGLVLVFSGLGLTVGRPRRV